MPRGLSVHVFKNPTQQAPLPPSYYTASKGQSGQDWSVNDSSRPKFERKASSTPNDPLRIAQPVYVDPKNAKSSRGRAVYPYSSIDTYIYDRSFSTAPDALAASPSSSSSESDIFSESAVSASVDISSTRASSSTETLETTALAIEYPSSASRPSYPRAGASNWSDGTRILPPGLPPVSRSASMSIRANGTLPKPGLVWLPPVDAVSDTEDDTFVDDGDDAGMSQGRPVAFATRDDGARDPRYTGSRSALVPMRRPSDERTTTQQLPLQRGGSEGTRSDR
ncbi:hypothetical protein EVJ58_g7060 [Rhodofomes roseus]|uniref:Uncharacterized protein n=1 Tax=Rhodofomes roseus TaxID=34475 RepID=A0A4Y9Y624_9APHY|nr:hypothetical protein EVJ58_g7060 [Rhodofomes roseus]